MEGHLGEAFSSTNGILQGCPISVLLMNLFSEVWVRAAKAELGPSALPEGYADDIGIMSHDPVMIYKGCALTSEYASLTGMLVNATKSHTWATLLEHRVYLTSKCKIGGKKLSLVSDGRRLGAHISYKRARAATAFSKKLELCRRLCERIQHLPLPLGRRAHLVAAGFLSKAIYGCAATPPSRKDVSRLRASAARAVWGQTNRWRSVEMLFTVLCPGHRADPFQAVAYNTIMVARRVLKTRPHLWETYCNVWELRMAYPDAKHIGGPVLALTQAVKDMDGQLRNPGFVRYRTSDNETDGFLLVGGEDKNKWPTKYAMGCVANSGCALRIAAPASRAYATIAWTGQTNVQN